MKHLKDIQSLLENLEMPGMGSSGKVESWVNIKVDKDLPIRISRYATALDEYIGISNDLHKKLEYLSDPLKKGKTKGVQAKLSIMILLQYLKEIKNNFDASSAGLLFEDYIAGLLHSRKQGGQGHADYIDDTGKTYQIKFYRESSGKIEINMTECDSYIVGVKYYNSIKVWIIEHKSDKDKYMGLADRFNRSGEFVKQYRFIDVKKIKDELEPFELGFNNIDRLIKQAGQQLKDSITKLYKAISEMNYNIETIITGVDKEKKSVGADIDSYYTGATDSIEIIGEQLESMHKDLKRKVRRYR